MERKTGIGKIEIHNRNFISREEAIKYAKRLQNYIYNQCKNNDYLAQAIIRISNTIGEGSSIKYISNGKIGRPKKEIVINKLFEDDYIREWHIHILIVSYPSYSFWECIKEYVDKNWKDATVYKNVCNINFIDYIINQSIDVLFCNYNYSNEDNLQYTLKQYYYEYLKFNSNMDSVQSKNGKKFMTIRYYFINLFPHSKYNKVQKNKNSKNGNKYSNGNS